MYRKTGLIFCVGGLLFFTACTVLSRSRETGFIETKQSKSKQSQTQQLEKGLSSKKELDQYSRALPFFKDESERIEFLEIHGYEARQKWLAEKNLFLRSASIQKLYSEIVDGQDIAIGMPQNLVRKSWGEPDVVEVSGNANFKNERWHYNRYISSANGYKPEKKLVYFEGGRVVGWESE